MKMQHLRTNRLSIFAQFLLVSMGASSALAAEAEWELRRDRDGIQVYTADVEGSPHDAVRSVTVVSGVPLSAMVALIDDAEACPEWADRCAESYIVERVSEHEAYIYTHNDMPFPIRDRDVVAHMQWSQDPESLVVELNSRSVSGKLEEVDGRLRLTDVQVQWRFEPLDDGSVRVSNQAHVDPGSSLPGWVTNILLVDTPFETMRGFVSAVRAPEYLDADPGFIINP